MRIAYTLEQCWHRVPGGTAVAALELARELVLRPNIELVGVSARHRNPPPPEWQPPIAVHPLPLPQLALYEGWHRLRWPPVERATGPVDVIHATGIAMPPATNPVVLTVHDLAYLDYPEMFSRGGLRFFRRALELAIRDAVVVLCSSRATLARCRDAGFDDRRLRHVPLGVETVPTTEARIDETLARLGLRPGYILWTGTIEPRKNVPSLLRAFAQVEASVDLVLVGPPGWNEDLEAVLHELPVAVRERVRRPGWVARDDLAALYAGAGVFCFPSLLEGFGFPVVEAMTYGTPVVTSLGTSTEELAEGGAGLLVDPTDVDGIASALSNILGDDVLAARLAEAGRERAGRYTWDATADLVSSAYREALSSA